MNDALALDASNITKISVGIIVVLVILGVLLSMIVTAIIARIIVLAVVVVLAIAVWQQRTHVENKISKSACQLNATFFGVHLDVPSDIARSCRAQRGSGGARVDPAN